MKKFQAIDFFGCDELLNTEERTTRDMVREWVDSRYMPRVAEYFDLGIFDRDLIPEIARMGLLGVKLHEYGLPGKSNVMYGLICRELERGDSGLRSFVSVQNSLVMFPISTFGSREQQDRWIPALAKGEAIGCFGLTEPHTGSDPSSLNTSALREGDSYILNGKKMWISNGEIANVAIIWARAEDGIRGFLVERGTPGFEARPILKKYAQRASVTSALALNNVRVPVESMLPYAVGLKSALMCVAEARYGVSWGAVGAAMACYDAALAYSMDRAVFGAPISSYQLVQRKLVAMLTEITKAQLMCIHLGHLKDRGKAHAAQVSMAKMNNVHEALKIARTAREILGANGINLNYHVIRHLLNLEAVYTYEGTHDIHILTIGRHITGYNAFSPGISKR